jgi:proteasome accessory factor A
LQEAEKLEWSDPWLQSIDLEYHNVALENGLYYELMREGQMRRFITEDDVRKAIFQPPEGTRAFFRGRAVAKFNREIETIQWDEITFASNGNTCAVNLPHPSHNADLDRLNAAIRDARSFAELTKRLAEVGVA